MLARTETSPEDIGGMHAAAGILTSQWHDKSRAGVAQAWECCVAGCGALIISEGQR